MERLRWNWLICLIGRQIRALSESPVQLKNKPFVTQRTCCRQKGHCKFCFLVCLSRQSWHMTWPQGASTTKDFFSSQTWHVCVWPFNRFFGGSAGASRETFFQEIRIENLLFPMPTEGGLRLYSLKPKSLRPFSNTCSGRPMVAWRDKKKILVLLIKSYLPSSLAFWHTFFRSLSSFVA